MPKHYQKVPTPNNGGSRPLFAAVAVPGEIVGKIIYHCGNCDKVLMHLTAQGYSLAEIVCPRCNALNQIEYRAEEQHESQADSSS